MIQKVLELTNSAQCQGDINMAMHMMRLDQLEQELVIKHL